MSKTYAFPIGKFRLIPILTRFLITDDPDHLDQYNTILGNLGYRPSIHLIHFVSHLWCTMMEIEVKII